MSPIFSMLSTVALIAIAIIFFVIILNFRRVVSTNEVHIVQSSRKTTSFGKDQSGGNTYYAWPSWIPILGVKISRLPMSVFQERLEDYAAYDKGRLPFQVDIIAFFRISDSNTAAQRVSTFDELRKQLQGILQGALRSILAKSEIEQILEARSEFGEMFTKEVDVQLKEWGIQNVKCIELMDIRDTSDSKVIYNIMAKKKSLIEMQSRTEVAGNLKSAQVAEVEAERDVNLRKQDAAQQVGVKTAEAKRDIAIAEQKALQQVKEEEKTTTEKSMDVQQVSTVRQAEIAKAAKIVSAEQDKQVAITVAEGNKQKTVLGAEATLEAAKREAEGTQVMGLAKAEAEKAILLAPVAAQITLAEKIGESQGYQTYLISIRQIEANQVVGIEQAKAMEKAEIKIFSNSGSPAEGMDTARKLFSTGGGLALGSALEALKSTEVGAAVVEKLTAKAA